MIKSSKLALFGGEPLIPSSHKFPKWPDIQSEEIQTVIAHLRNEDLAAYETLSGPLFNFETDLKRFFGVNYALLTSSGTSALYSAYSSLKLSKGDEILIPSITFPGTGSVALHLGANIRLIDVDPISGNPSLENILSVISDRTKAIVIAHAWGIPADIYEFLKLKEKGIFLIEDASRSCGSEYNFQKVGSFGDAAAISFHEQKAIPAGSGGVFLTDNEEFLDNAVVLGHYYRSKTHKYTTNSLLKEFSSSGLGLNLEIHPLGAALGHLQLKKLEGRIKIMNNNYSNLINSTSNIEHIKFLPIPPKVNKVSFYGFNFHWNINGRKDLPSKESIILALKAEGLMADKPGSPPLSTLPIFNKSRTTGLPGICLGDFKSSNFRGALLHHKTLVRLPNLRDENGVWVQFYAEALKKIMLNLKALKKWESIQ